MKRKGKKKTRSARLGYMHSLTVANEESNFPEKVRGQSILTRQASCDNPPRDNPRTSEEIAEKKRKRGGTRPFLGDNHSFSVENFLSSLSFFLFYFLFKSAVKSCES